jgi:hypothetical protein
VNLRYFGEVLCEFIVGGLDSGACSLTCPKLFLSETACEGAVLTMIKNHLPVLANPMGYGRRAAATHNLTSQLICFENI